RQHRRLVHAGADGPDHALRPEAFEGGPGSLDRLSPVVIGIMDEGAVDPGQAEPLEALLERASDAVGAVVEDDANRIVDDVVGILAPIESLAVDVGAGRDARSR